ncbi:alpha/beta-hydrolase [Lepidopterella palustris CBS 459.81]|uniref:Alpha/beta-hydrolase n=1 Tax=Lepidopterella palustris CBS 459.81 TaxID=1314670 RepID=A0A8E2EG05_9PEZI|nr:alpha/beta-hydrolase [Lepidopterella palustris CBS 459.81]
MANKPTILLVTGSFSPPPIYDLVVSRLKDVGFEVVVPHLPSIGRTKDKDPAPGLSDDVALIRSELTRLVSQQEKHVLIIGHSYGGVPATESIHGFSKAEREKEGRSGGVVRILYSAAVLPEIGETAAEFFGGKFADFVVIDDKHWAHLETEGAAKANFGTLPHEQGVKWASKFQEHSIVTFSTPLTNAGYKDVDVSYLVTEEDSVIPPDKQLRSVDRIEKESGRKVDVQRVKTGHSAYVLDPDAVANVISKAAGL